MKLPPINAERVTDYIVRRLRWYVLKYAKKNSGIIGISGGVDSAVTAYLSVRALGPERVYCYILPSDTTPTEDIDDAVEVIKRLRIPEDHWELINIESIVKGFEKSLGELTNIEKGNLMARVRMIILHQRAYRHDGLVIGTSDKSELLIGYFTKYGDGGVDILPIGGLYKTHVRQLAEHLGVPEKIVKKPSSPRLWPGQTAESELGISYDLIDLILYYRFEEWLPEGEIAKRLGISEEIVRRIMDRVKKTQHKRLPPEIFHIGYRDLGSDWRYPREWI
ncbi:MAG: NAD(+) synthetase [Thermoprotei archaeon]|nr:MAG: NAD(+) synthetase [Thermoprotei archaeon]